MSNAPNLNPYQSPKTKPDKSKKAGLLSFWQLTLVLIGCGIAHFTGHVILLSSFNIVTGKSNLPVPWLEPIVGLFAVILLLGGPGVAVMCICMQLWHWLMD